ncbi:MAG: hypothetical protein ABFS41_04565 [Myxococcota bacterium]
MSPEVGRPWKIIVWATGGVGRYAIRTIADRPGFELVGAWVHSAGKDGKDAGELAGIAPLGVRATRDVDALLATDADCVVYAGPAASRPREAQQDFCRILAAGKNIVTTSLPGLVYGRGSLPERYLAPIREACEKGGASIFASGIEPGFGCDLFPVALMTMSHTVHRVRGTEIYDYSRYPVAWDMRELFGLGKPLDYTGGLKQPGAIRAGWGAAVTLVADALGVELEAMREVCEFAPAPRRIETATGPIEAGTVAGVRFELVGVVGGEDVIVIEHCDRTAGDVAPDWPKSRKGGWQGTFRVQIDGEPSIDAEFEVGFREGQDENDHGLLATGMRAVNAIPWVCEAAPGIVDALQLPLTAPRGALRPKRDGVPAFD